METIARLSLSHPVAPSGSPGGLWAPAGTFRARSSRCRLAYRVASRPFAHVPARCRPPPLLGVPQLLGRLASDGELARWELLEDFTTMTSKHIWRSCSKVLHAVESGEMAERERMRLARAGPKQGPYVGKEPRARNKDGSWRKKRSDAKKPRPAVRKGK